MRVSLGEIIGISKPELERIICEQPFDSVTDFYLRARPSRRTLEKLALVGALDAVAGISKEDAISNRADLLVKIRQLSSKAAPALDKNQLAFDLKNLDQLPTGNSLPTEHERLESELSETYARWEKLDALNN